MSGQWIRRPTEDTVVVFVHGILSSGEECWRNPNGTQWPDLVAQEPDLAGIGVYSFSYYTAITSGGYTIGDAVDSLREELRLDGVTAARRWIFVCHSMGGIVVRRYLVANAVELHTAGVSVGLFLVASPSLGSEYANLLERVIEIFGHRQAEALKLSQANTWLNDLDKDFLKLKERQYVPLRGKEIVEDKFIVLKGLLRRQVVEPFSGARYFDEPVKIPKSDHMSIAKPENAGAFQHRLLKAFILECIQDAKLDPESRRPASAAAAPAAAASTAAAAPRPLAQAVEHFLGGDPILGNQALAELLAAGDRGEAALFDRGLHSAGTTQIYRRWMQFVAERSETVGERLLAMLDERTHRHLAAELCAGLPRDSAFVDRLYTRTANYFEYDAQRGRAHPRPAFAADIDGARASLLAYGCAGGSIAWLLDCVSGSSHAWEKARAAAFAGSCYSFARGNVGYDGSFAKFIVSRMEDPYHGLQELAPEDYDSNDYHAVPASELLSQAYRESFLYWMRGDVVDTLLARFAQHPHGRLRQFTARALTKVTLPRVERLLREWREREPIPAIRGTIADALFTLDCRAAKPSFLAEYAANPELGADNGLVVMLAKHGHRHTRLERMLDSADWYERACGVMAAGYLRDDAKLGRTDAWLDGTLRPAERVMICAGLTLAGRRDLPSSLGSVLAEAAVTPDDLSSGVDVRRLFTFVQVAIVDALEIGASAEETSAWRAEMGPVQLKR